MHRVRDINWNDPKYIRAGIIPFVESKGVRFYGFAIDGLSGDMADFGGHRETSDQDALDAAIREYREEGLNVFGELTRDSVQNYYVLDGSDTIEILLPVPGPFYQYTVNFRNLVRTNIEHEAQNIVWLTREQVLTAIDLQDASFAGIKIYRMYFRIRNLLQTNRSLL